VKDGQFSVELNLLMQEISENRDDFRCETEIICRYAKYDDSEREFLQRHERKMDFVVKNNKAEKRNISLGRENPLYYEVVSD
jgi:HlyD family secretion protein